VHQWRVGQVDIVRVEDENFALGSDRVVPEWAVPALAPSRTETLIAFSAFVIRDGDHHIVVDPWLANDFPRDQPDAADHVDRLLGQLEALGLGADRIDTVVNTHFDGVGWNTRPTDTEAWTATFPNARYLYPRAELEAWRTGEFPTGDPSFELLAAAGLLDAVDAPHRISPHVELIDAPGHAAGHLAVQVESGDEVAVIPGHLILNVFQLADPAEAADLDPPAACASRRRLLDELADRRGLLLTTLIGGPGGGWVRRDGPGFAIDV
jgi:glyoxylase-like metal-dependent hydrolase (beta-lactamase superfamily II)